MPWTSSDTTNDGTGFLGDLEPSITTYHYCGKQQAISIVKKEVKALTEAVDSSEVSSSEWVLFTGIDKRTFSHDFNTTDEDRSLNWNSFDSSLNLLLARMALAPHEEAVRSFDQLLLEALRPMGLDDALYLLGSATNKTPAGAKQADSQWSPRRAPPGRSRHQPSVVLEVALSETLSKLTSDVRYWLQRLPPRDEVKLAIILAINQQRPEIAIESWERKSSRPHCTQHITISMSANKQVTVHDEPLVIEFQKLFLRPSESSRETDIRINADMLKKLAVKVWELQRVSVRGINWIN
jgi:hypothetical protein